jgi:hypothetical protein
MSRMSEGSEVQQQYSWSRNDDSCCISSLRTGEDAASRAELKRKDLKPNSEDELAEILIIHG